MWAFTPGYQLSTNLFFGYIFVLFFFSAFGAAFCFYFRQFTKRAYEEEIIHGRFRDNLPINRHMAEEDLRLRRELFVLKATISAKINRFENSRYIWLTLGLVAIIVFTIIPIDSQFGVFTPRIQYRENFLGARYPDNNLFVVVQTDYRNGVPEITANCSKLEYDAFFIEGIFDKLGAVNVALPPSLMGRSVTPSSSASNVNDWDEVKAFVSYPLNQQLFLTKAPDSNRLTINYSKLE